MGVIDSLSAGFAIVARRFWLVSIPVGVDLFLWLGVRLSVEPLVRRWVAFIGAFPSAGGTEVLPEEARAALLEWAAHSNLFALLRLPGLLIQTTSAGWLMPAGEGGAGGQVPIPGLQRPVVELSSLGAALAVGVVLFLVGMLVSAVYLSLVAQGVRRDNGDRWTVSWRTVRLTWGRLVAYALTVGLLLVMLWVPLSLLTAMAFVTGSSFIMMLLNFSVLVFLWLWLWLMLYLLFAVAGIVMNGMGVWPAAWTSVHLVGRNFWSTAGLFLLCSVIAAGTGVIWSRLSGSAWGMLAGIVGQGFIQTGLVAATLIFFWARWQQLTESAAPGEVD